MTIFNGKNNLKTSRLAFERAKDKLEAFEGDYPMSMTWALQKDFHGRVNRLLEPVVVKEEFLKR